jgi:RNA polymerase I-specific transcription initiation factor RRN5
VYPKNPPMLAKPDSDLEDATNGLPSGDAAGAQILQEIPEACLLRPEVMLTLSRELFMNRSDDILSPWPHWSHYVSELAAEPCIYRTAFNDFHRLVISVTKRLVQIAIVQATSRMRSQRSRKERGSQPLVKSRDIYTAIDVLGMKRNGGERWRGVPRRCGLKVTTSKLTPQGRRTRHVPWTEVESMMHTSSLLNERSNTSAEPNNFKSRAARSGTPLPIHTLTLTDAEDEVVEVEMIDDEDSESSEHFTDVEQRSPAPRTLQRRDHTGRYATVPPEEAGDETPRQSTTIEEFDQEATRHQEKALWDMFGVEPLTTDDGKDEDEVQDLTIGVDEKITTLPKDWRLLLEYRTPWEKYQTPVSVARLLANQEPLSSVPATDGLRTYSTASPSGNLSDASSTMQPRRTRLKSVVEIDLHVRGTNAYAALQREGLQSGSPNDSISEARSATPEEDVPTQSIEAGQSEINISDSASEMDWS